MVQKNGDKIPRSRHALDLNVLCLLCLQYRSDAEERVQKLEAEAGDLRQQLEDLQFRLEEEAIARADSQGKPAPEALELERLEKQLAEEREQAEDKLFEAEEALTRLKDELEKNK